MKISFVIPANNEEAYIRRCLDAIFAGIRASSIDAEVIVVNNASTDSTRVIVEKYPHVIIVDEGRKGLSYARQAGFAASTGDIIANVDADNIITQDWIGKVLKEFTKNKKLVALSGPVVFYDLAWYFNIQVRIFYILAYIVYVVNHFVLRTSGMLQGGNFVLRKSALDKIGGYDTNFSFYGEDADIARRMQKIGYVKFTFGLPILSSGRRLAREGILNAGAKYAINYLWVVMLKRPFHKEQVE